MENETAEVIRSHTPGALEAITTAGMQMLGGDPVTSAIGGVMVGLGLALDQVGYVRRAHRAQHVVDVAAPLIGGEVELVRRVLEDDAHLELTMQVLEAAARSAYEDKLRALAKVLAQGLSGDTVDETRFLVAAIADLEAPHVQVLHAISGHEKPHVADARMAGMGWTIFHLAELLPGYSTLLWTILSTLSLHGLVRDISSGLTTQPMPRYLPSELGVAVLKLLTE